MLIAEIPTDEKERIDALLSLDVLDTPPDDILDGLVRTAAAVIGCPMSALSLVDERRQWLKARFGIDFIETSRDVAVCSHTILQHDILEIPDCLDDSRFFDNPLMTAPNGIRFYAGVPITIDGHHVGSFCVMDHVPKALNASQRAMLADLGRVAQHWLESRREQKALVASSSSGKTLFDYLEDGVILVDRAGQIRDANASALKMIGCERRELIGQALATVLPNCEYPVHGIGHPGPGNGGCGGVRECEMRRKNGNRFTAEVYARFMEDCGCVVVVRDVTQRRADEQLMRQQSQAIEQSFAGITIIDPRGRFVYANKAALAMYGYNKEELIGKDRSMLRSLSIPDEVYEANREMVLSGRSYVGTLPARRKDGTEFAQETSSSPIFAEDGSVASTLFITADTTEKEQLRAELEQHRNQLEELVEQRTEELAQAKLAAEAASHAKSEFLASMSHEIRTPMNGVLGIVEVLRVSLLDPYQIELADTIRDSALALLGIIDELLDFSKIEAGHLEVNEEPVDVLTLAESVCDALLPVATARGVSLDVFVSPDLPQLIVSDDLRLHQILNNLLGNAIKFSSGRSEPGRVRLRVEPVGSTDFRIVVADNGIGIARRVQKRIFEPFVQADGATTRRFGGTGLGLSICQKLANLFGGQIALKSAPDKGSVFTVTLPLRSVASKATDATINLLEGLHCHILLNDLRRARDWGAYLTAAGATVKTWRKAPSLQTMRESVKDSRHMLLIDWDDPASANVRVAATELGIPLVQVHQGTQRGSQMIQHGTVGLEVGAVRRATLIDAVARATGRRSAAAPAGSAPVKKRPRAPDRAEAIAHKRLILVAEDNDLNQKVIEHQLVLLGYSADLAVNGVEAFERWRSGEYAVLMTDLHMPRMDGYTLTAQIRAEEGARAASPFASTAVDAPPKRLPIVALTANALRGEAERCLALGMDDYLTKPLQLEALAQTLARWLPQPATLASSTEPSWTDAARTVEDARRDTADDLATGSVAVDEGGSLPVYDPTTLPKLLGDNPEVLAEVRREFVVQATTTAKALRAAASNGECATVGSLAHRIKSSARAIGGIALGECCARLEEAGAAGPRASLDPLLVEFEASLTMLLIAMEPDDEQIELFPEAPPVAAIVVVDDEPLQLRLVKRELQFQSAPVYTYDSAAAALASLANRDTSALLLLFDLNMPQMDGVELMRCLAERRYAGAIALISGADTRVLETASKLATAYNLNVLGYLTKPFEADALREVVGHWQTFMPGASKRASKAYDAAAIRHAIDHDQLFLQYQPKVSLKDGSVVGVEALVRWRHPVDGVVYPDRFIDVAENHDLIDDLTYTVLEKAVAQARRWKDGGIALRVAVNISMRNLARMDFPGRILEIIQRHGIEPADLVMEVTESTLMADARAPLSTLTRLRMRTVGLSIDDFGTGHSSLAQLRDIPFDELKIDRGFVHGIGNQPTQQAIFLASLNMAHQLNMTVVAEGIEDAADWDFVRDAGCDVAQGYHIARPMDANAVGPWARKWTARHVELRDVQR
jgi:PAS domain S-box-containing protein